MERTVVICLAEVVEPGSDKVAGLFGHSGQGITLSSASQTVKVGKGDVDGGMLCWARVRC